MKQFIVLMGVLPILILFMMQMGLDQKNSQITSIIQASVYAAKEDAKQEGYFSKEIKQKLKNDITRLTGISSDKINIQADSKVKYRYSLGEERLIYYRVSVKIGQLMAAPGMHGISQEENSYNYVIDSYTASEKV
ncbi:hypothetical protein [Aminipila terrae]|uniref:Uncharacterized protein n=1 Tax=Aminipila terrae TaxID=2697030 RepID=A0A6P1MND8_9FIRM|nr:hypothetical protein [Aminipila terrae]QHI73186.1 hypothetical protein Ami3637_13105 [Aminipila terrae]